MITRSITAILLALSLHSFAQQATCTDIAEQYLIKKVKGYSSMDLIPYYSKKEDRWGYMDRISKKKLTEPIFSSPEFFSPTINPHSISNSKKNSEWRCRGEIKGSKDHYDTSDFVNIFFEEPEVAMRKNIDRIDYTKMFDSSIEGFKVNTAENLVAFNPKFYNSETKEPILRDISTYQDEHYAKLIVSIIDYNYRFSIINSKGEAIEGFKDIDSYPISVPRFTDNNGLWFGLKEPNDEYLLKDAISNKVIGKIKDRYEIENRLSSFLGYAIVSLDKNTGVLDLTTMEWKIKPDAKNNFTKLYYSSLEELDSKMIKNDLYSLEVLESNRKKANVYILTADNYFYDLEMNSYQVK